MVSTWLRIKENFERARLSVFHVASTDPFLSPISVVMVFRSGRNIDTEVST